MDSRLAFLLSISLVSAYDYMSRCLYFNKTCVSNCPRMMHAYHLRCDKDTMSQRTCDSPFAYPIGYTCGWSRCDCNGDMMLDEDRGICVPLKACPRIRSRRRPHRRRRKQFRMSKKIKLDENADLVDLAT